MEQQSQDGEAASASTERATVALINNRFTSKGELVREASAEEVVEVSRFETMPAIVRRGYSLTMNLGNYESAKVDVGIEVPCYLEDVEAADEWAKRWVELRIRQEVRSVREDSPPPAKKRGGGAKRGSSEY